MTRIVRLLALLTVVGCACAAHAQAQARGVSLARDAVAGERFDPKQSAALFVGVRQFPYDATLADVRYAVDDAIDLAFVLALDGRVRLVDPTRVILALSGEPRKAESQRNLDQLIAAGAQRRAAGQTDVLNALDEQTRAAGKGGLLVVAFATHGVSDEGTQYLFTATSLLKHIRDTALSESKIRDIASHSAASRSLILVDACRERLTDAQRSSEPDRLSAASRIEAMSNVHGQVVLSAAATGQYAYDDETRRNGVFTAAVIDGLRCGASRDKSGFITVDTLATFVEDRVLEWIRAHRNAGVERATQVITEGAAKSMPLAECTATVSGKQEDHCSVSIASSPSSATVSVDGRKNGDTPLLVRLADGPYSKVEVAKPGYRVATTYIGCGSTPVFLSLQPIPGTPQVLFTERFDDNHNHWYTSSDPQAPAKIEDGRYLITGQQNQLRFGAVAQQIDQDAEFQIAVTGRWVSGDPEMIYGLLFGIADGGTFFLFAVNAKGNPSVGILQNGNGHPINDPSVTNPNIRTGTGVNRLRVAKVGKRLRYFVNDALVYEMDFRPLFGPGVGVFTISGPIVAEFDDLTIEGVLKQAQETIPGRPQANAATSRVAPRRISSRRPQRKIVRG